MDRFSQACIDLGLTISLKNTNVLGQDVDISPVITIDNYELNVVHQFTFLSSTISDLSTCVWENLKLTVATKIAVYETCIISTLLYGSEV